MFLTYRIDKRRYFKKKSNTFEFKISGLTPLTSFGSKEIQTMYSAQNQGTVGQILFQPKLVGGCQT